MNLTLWRQLLQLRDYDAFEFLRLPPHRGTKVTLKRRLNLYLVRLQRLLSHKRLFGYPLRLTVEASTACNLACPACLTGAGERGREGGHLPVGVYEQVIDELGDYLFEVELHNWGEPLMNKHIAEIVALASAKGVGTILSTNFSMPFDADRAEALVEAGLTTLGVSLDGASQETYEQYRINGSFEQVLRNVHLMNAAKRKLGSKTPRIIWSFHVFAHNADDVGQASAMATELGMVFEVSKAWVIGQEWNPASPYKLFTPPSVDGCDFLWGRAVLNTDGGVAPCNGAFFKEDDFGSVIDGTFLKAWNNSTFRRAREFFQSTAQSNSGERLICQDCPEMATRHDYLNHLANGGTRGSFKNRFTSNDGYSYFFNRRDSRRKRPVDDADGELIPIEPVPAASTPRQAN